MDKANIEKIVRDECIRLKSETVSDSTIDEVSKNIVSLLTNNSTEIFDESRLLYNVSWITQLMLRSSSLDTIRLDIPDETFYPAHPAIPIPGFPDNLDDTLIFHHTISNYEDALSGLDPIDSLFRKQGDIVLVTNHATWFNIPLISHLLQAKYSIAPSNIYAGVGPAITHSKFHLAGIQRFANVLKTWPDTPRADIPGTDSLKNSIRLRFLKTLLSISKIPHTNNSISDKRVIIIAPSGTTDKVKDQKICMLHPNKSVEKMISSLIKQGYIFGAIGINDTEVIPPGMIVPQRGEVYVQSSEVTGDDWTSVLPSLVIDSDMEQLGEWSQEKSLFY